MRLTASRQSPNHVSKHPKNFRHPKPKSKPPNDRYPQILCDCNPIFSDTGKCGSRGLRAAPYHGAVRAPRRPAYSNPLPDPTTLNAWTCKSRLLSDTVTNNPLPQVSPLTDTQTPYGTLHTRKLGFEMRPRDEGRSYARHQPLVDRRRI